MVDLILYYLGYRWLTCILYKDNLLPNFIGDLGEKSKGALRWFLCNLSRCKFCMDNWMALFCFAIPLTIYTGDMTYLGTFIIFSSISSHFG